MISHREFRADKDLVRFAQEIFKDRTFQLMMEANESEHPIRKALAADKNDDVSPTAAAIELGLQKGYQVYPDNLRLLAVPLSADDGGLPESQYVPEPVERPQKPTAKPKPIPKKKVK